MLSLQVTPAMVDMQAELENGIAALEQKKWDEAINAFKKVTEVNPKHHLGWYNLALALGKKGKDKLDEAIAACEKCVAIEPDFFKGWTNLGWFYTVKNNPEKATEACNKAIAIKPDYNLAWINLGVAMRVAGNLDGALDAFKKATELKGVDHEAWANLAVVYSRKNNIVAALDARQKAIKILAPDDHAESYTMFIKMKPGDPDTVVIMGIANESKQSIDPALALYKIAIEKEPGFSLALFGAAMIAEAKELFDDAIDYYKQLAELNLDVPEFRQRLEALAKRKFLQGMGDVFPAGEKYAFFVCAGASMYPPSSVPPIREIARVLLEQCVPADEVLPLLSLDDLGLRSIIKQFTTMLDPELKFAGYFDLPAVPNPMHAFLARAAKAGHVIITTNYDSLIERAMLLLHGQDTKDFCKAIITKQDFEACADADAVKGKNVLVKVLGSPQNLITGEKTMASMLPWQGAQDATLETPKRALLQSLTAGRCLVVIGHSDEIDFPVLPLLKELPGIKSLVWLQSEKDDPAKDNATWQHFKAASKVPAHLVKASAIELVESGAWTTIAGEAPPSKPAGMKPPPRPDFKHWLAGLIKPLDEVTKHAMATSMYSERNQQDAMLRCASKGIEIATMNQNVAALAIFSNYLAQFHEAKKDYDTALKHYQDTITYADQLGAVQEKVIALAGMGKIQLAKGDEDNALKILSGTLDLAEQAGELQAKAKCLSSISSIHEGKGNHDEALKAMEEAVAIAEKLGDRDAKMKRLNNLGLIYDAMGFKNKALQQYQDALKIAEELGNLSIKAKVLNNIAAIYRAKDDNDQALKHFTDALAIDGKLGNKADMASELLAIGMIWQKRNDNKKALAFVDRAAKLFEECKLADDLEAAKKVLDFLKTNNT
ncbi:MAG: tetratricopeptide repeat protein [Candidatus Lokiarchaeota archaeon]|nr:tetratricopeptide repeat protein [Candidatus Lokiarchaeota archaeon]